MITIENVDTNPREQGPHKYLLRVNREDICTFVHNREKSLRDCLLAAIAALPVEASIGIGTKVLFTQVMKDSDEKHTLAEIGDLGVVTGRYDDDYLVLNQQNNIEFLAGTDEFRVMLNQ